MQKLMPGKNYSVKPFNAQEIKVNPTQFSGKLGEFKNAAAGIEKDIQKNRADFEKDFDGAKAEAMKAVAESAMKQGLDPVQALATVAPPRNDSDLNLMTDVLCGMAGGFKGGGTFATFLSKGGSASSLAEVLGETSKLSESEAASVLASAYSSLAPEPGHNPTFETTAAPAIKSRYDWRGLGKEGFEEFLKAPKALQPEMEALDEAEASIKDVKENHKLYEENMERGTINSPEAATEDHETGTPVSSFEITAQTSTLGDVRGVEMQGSAIQDITMTCSATRDHIASLNLEPDPRFGLRRRAPSPQVSMG